MSITYSVKRCQRRNKQTIVDLFGGKCMICGYNQCTDALEFHHTNPSEKEYAPSYLINSRSVEQAMKELSKCVMLCSNCHREVHADLLDISYRREIKVPLQKVCKYCKADFTTLKYDQIYCSVSCKGKDSRKVVRPTRSELKNLIKQRTWVDLGRMFGVSDNAVRKWARKYKLIT